MYHVAISYFLPRPLPYSERGESMLEKRSPTYLACFMRLLYNLRMFITTSLLRLCAGGMNMSSGSQQSNHGVKLYGDTYLFKYAVFWKGEPLSLVAYCSLLHSVLALS